MFFYGIDGIKEIYAIENSKIYFFSPKRYVGKYKNSVDLYNLYVDNYIGKTYNKINKYWGNIETIVNGNVCGKIIEMNPGTQSSLEYHVNKKESYYLDKGILDIGLRTGRALNSIHTIYRE